MVVSSFASLDKVLESQIPEQWRSLFPALLSLLDMERSLQQRPTIRSIRPRQVAQSVTLPTLLVHGDQDTFVSVEQGKYLYEALGSADKKWLTVPKAGHRNVLATPMPLYSEMSEWLLDVLPHKTNR